MSKSYDNEITESEVSLAIERLLVAPENTEYGGTGKIDLDSLPAGFVDLGAVVEDTPTLTITKEKYQLKLGLPKALQFEAIIGIEGSFAVQVWAKSNDIVRRAMGVDIVTITTIGSRLPFGRTTLTKFSVIGVADFIDGTQVVHYFPEVSVKPEYTENIRPDEAGKITLGYDLYSHISTIHGDERIVGERFYFEA